jgi:SAM-dependent methyltransferase
LAARSTSSSDSIALQQNYLILSYLIMSKQSKARNYNKKNYWDKRYQQYLVNKTDNDAEELDVTDEWYYSTSDVVSLLSSQHNYRFSAQQRILDIGCGLSNLFRELINDHGFSASLMLGIDYSPNLIDHRNRSKEENEQHNIYYQLLDACSEGLVNCNELLQEESFDLIIDKATSDGLLTSEATAAITPIMYSNSIKLLKPNGLYLISSVNDPNSLWFTDYILNTLVEDYLQNSNKYLITVHSLKELVYSDGDREGPNIYVIHKLGRKFHSRTVNQSSQPYTVIQLYH